MRAHVLIALLASVPLVALSFAAVPEAANYRYSFLFLVPILWGTFLLRRAIHLHPFHYALFALGLLLHDLGALGCYRREFLGLSFDTYVHFYCGLAGWLILERAFREELGLRDWRVSAAALACLLGLGAVHELIEFGSTLALGDGVGMYKRHSSDEFDTQKDLFNNLLGGAVALLVSRLYGLARTRAQRS